MSGSMVFWKNFVNVHPETGHKGINPECVQEVSAEKFFRGFAKEFDFSGFNDVEYDTYSGEHKKQHIKVVFDPDADFHYFDMSASVHDGTLYFVYQNIENVVKKVVAGGTYYKLSGSPKTGSFITYTVGNFIVINETGNFGSPKKPWLHEKTTVLLPIKYEVQKHHS